MEITGPETDELRKARATVRDLRHKTAGLAWSRPYDPNNLWTIIGDGLLEIENSLTKVIDDDGL